MLKKFVLVFSLSSAFPPPRRAPRCSGRRPPSPPRRAPCRAAGGPARLALKVSLPRASTRSRTRRSIRRFIPTVLTIDAPAGVTVDEIVYPPAIELKQQGLDQPLAVFEHEFVVGVQVTLGPGVAAGDLSLRPACATRLVTT